MYLLFYLLHFKIPTWNIWKAEVKNIFKGSTLLITSLHIFLFNEQLRIHGLSCSVSFWKSIDTGDFFLKGADSRLHYAQGENILSKNVHKQRSIPATCLRKYKAVAR